jgi:hypothetical protein
MTGPGETRLRQDMKAARDMGEVGFDLDDPKIEELDEGELWFADSLGED